MSRRIVKPRKITAKWLRTTGACEGEVARFGRFFPRGLKVTVRNYVKAIDQGFSEEVGWLIERVMDKRCRAAFYKAYNATGDEWHHARDRLDARLRDGQLTRKEYDKRVKAVNAAGNRADGRAFVEAWTHWKGRKTRRQTKRGKDFYVTPE
jgi:hypothetical protein